MSRTLEKALAHLEQEKIAILGADFATLSKLAPGTQELARICAQDPAIAEALQKPAERNRKLIEQSIKGIEQARAEVRAARKIRQSFGSYLQDGQHNQHVAPASKIQRSF